MSSRRKNYTQSSMVRRKDDQSEGSGSSGCSCGVFLISLLLVFTLALVVGLILSTQALPGDQLYPLKRYSEQVRRLLAASPSQRLELEQNITIVRKAEIEALAADSRSAEIDFSGGFQQVTEDGDWLVGDITVLVPPDTQTVGQITTGTIVTIFGTLENDGRIVARRVQPFEFEFTDRLNSVVSNQWLVDGLTVYLMPDTLVRGSPSLGSEVNVTALVLLDWRLVARLIEEP
jgi:hypothetical protein